MLKVIFLLIGCFFTTLTYAESKNINSVTIIGSTLKALPNCLHYQISPHLCFWMTDHGVVNTTPVVNHYLPDLVVSVFPKPHDNPWFEANKITDNLGEKVENLIVSQLTGFDAGSGNHSFQDYHEQGVIFKEADVFGNPAVALIPAHGLLPSSVTPLFPYYQSMTDSMLWRGIPPLALPDEALALGFDVKRHIGRGLVNWGGIYPHEGKVANDNDVKASSVIAARAIDLIGSKTQYGHIYKSIAEKCGLNCKVSPVKENSKNIYFQMIYPYTQNDCHILGDAESYSQNMLNPDGSYVWIVWRHYDGCADGVGSFLGKI